MLRGCAKRNQIRMFKKILSLIIFVKFFFENIRRDMLLKLILNLFSGRKRFKDAKLLSCNRFRPRFSSDTLQHDKARLLKSFGHHFCGLFE